MKNKLANKSLITNLTALIIIIIAYLLDSNLLKSMGFFALSGALTNWLAIHMLFEKVPFLYGSGVIPHRFEAFKTSIKTLMMQQFFTIENIAQFIENKTNLSDKSAKLSNLFEAMDYDKIYEGLVSAIMESSFGSMLEMMGGKAALAPIKEPFTLKIEHILTEMIASDKFKAVFQIGDDMVDKIETIIDQRLNELTPEMVKKMVEAIILEHLGWLVIWGGVFGGLLGAIFNFA
jgi:uncharacterized membrane protein YheB (UPF0754 family)